MDVGARPDRILPFLNALLLEAARLHASDLHLVIGAPPAFRVDGDIRLAEGWPDLDEATLAPVLWGLLDEDARQRFTQARRLCLSVVHPEAGPLRLSLYSHQGRIEAAIRLGHRTMPSPESLGLPATLVAQMNAPDGLILVTGATGAGKTTTLNALLGKLTQSEPLKIITVEDPVEFVLPPGRSLVVQQELGLDTDTFHGALIHALRQDPDVICIGEMRELETISTALTAAETGHLVLSTLHTNGAIGSISRLVDVFPAAHQPLVRVQISQTLRAVFSQRLLPRADGQGRVLVYELLKANEAVRNTIREGRMHQLRNVIQTSRAEGMVLMDETIREAYLSELITREVALSALTDPTILDPRLGERRRPQP